jgi:hypothetical protein
MNWTWNVRSNDGAMNGLEFARCTTAGGFGRVLIHAAPADAKIEIIDGDDTVVARADLQRTDDYSPMTLIELDGSAIRRSEVWQWLIEFSNHTGRPDDWAPEQER